MVLQKPRRYGFRGYGCGLDLTNPYRTCVPPYVGCMGCGMWDAWDAWDAGCGMRDARDAVAAVAIEFAMGFKLRKKCDLKSSLVLPFPSHPSCCLSRIPLSLVCPLLLHIPAHAVWPDWHHT